MRQTVKMALDANLFGYMMSRCMYIVSGNICISPVVVCVLAVIYSSSEYTIEKKVHSVFPCLVSKVSCLVRCGQYVYFRTSITDYYCYL